MLNMRVGLRAQHVCNKKMVTELVSWWEIMGELFLPVRFQIS